MSTGNEKTLKKLTRGLRSQYPLYYFLGWEEERMEKLLSVLVESLHKGRGKLICWSATNGFDDQETITGDPLKALARIHQEVEPTVYLLKDLPLWFEQEPALVRGLRDLYYHLRGRHIYVFISHPALKIPEALKKELYLIEMSLPSEADILAQLQKSTGAGQVPGDDLLYHMAVAMKGLSLNEVGHLRHRLYAMPDLQLRTAMTEIQEEKSQILAKESVLRFYPPQRSLDEIGGLDNLKNWVRKRQGLFTKEAFEEAMPLPGGILFMGISGCGKSLAAKTIATAWNMPLVRLDMSLVMSGSFGSPEYAFEHATRIAEEIAPLVLWIDELENAFGYDESGASSGNVNIFSSFLTWMQEKPAGVFLAATANRIQQLPAEMMRKGRFDQLFFLDLPTVRERAQIFSIHIRLNAQTPDGFDTGYLAAATKGWSGAEIEAAVKAARIEAWQEGRSFNENDVIRNTVNMVPLSRTMEEQIQAIKDWSFQRAVPASAIE